jgi:hypothetical protein
MPITLKHINYSDSDTIKLDKVNYNFDQLVANGGGPIGPQGPIGQSGPQGTTGQQGFQGPVGDIGYQGPPGPVTDNYWNKEAVTLSTSETVDYIVPIHTSINPVIQFAPVVNIGYIDTEAQYGIKDPLVGGRTPYQWLIKRKTYSSSNLRLLNGDALGNGIDFKLEKSLGNDKLTIGFIEYANSPVSTYKAAATFFRGTSASPYSLLIDTTSATFGTNTVFDSPVIVKERLIIQDPTADTDKIVVSEDLTGLSKFKSVQELGGTVPYGTIVSILPAIFADNTKFINTETVNPGMGVVPISVGKGIGNYEGWYLCNGQEWTDGTTNYLVPMLGKFNYDIEDNPFTTDPSSQGDANNSNVATQTHITGGSDIDMTATSVPTLVYNITSTVDTSTVIVGPNNGTTHKIKQLPQIIYLGRNDLYWFDPGTGQAPSVPVTWLLDDSNPDPDPAKRLNPDPYPLGTVSNQPEGASYTFVAEVETPGGYYWSTVPTTGDIGGLPTWATITGISLVPGQGTYPTKIAIGISVSLHPAALPNPSPETISIDTSAFISPSVANITLVRGNPFFATSTTPTTTNIQYNFATGYTFQLVYQANAGYVFLSNPISSVVYGGIGGPFNSPPPGGGTITILNYTLTNGNTTLTMNCSLTGLPTTGYLTTINYVIGTNYATTAPKITYNPGGYTIDGPSLVGGTSSPVTKTITVENNTGGTVYIWAGINQFFAGGGTTASISGGYESLGVFNLGVSAGTTTANYYSSNSRILANGQSVIANLYRAATSDSHHTVQLYWSSVPNPNSTQRYVITP